MSERDGGGLRVRVLGDFEVEGVEQRNLGARKARTLLKMLALARGRPVGVEALALGLWGDDVPARPGESVGVLVSRLRGVLGAARIARSDAGYRLAVDWLDVDAAGELTAEATARIASGSLSAARAAAGAALRLYRGPLLPDEPDAEWAQADRALAERSVAQARRVAAEAAMRSGDLAEAWELAEQSLERDPFDEASLRIAMAAQAASGRQAAALVAYETMRERLATELGVDPSPQTRAAHEAVLRGEPVPALVVERRRDDAHPGLPSGLPGRADSLRALDDALDGASGLELVVVSGEAGIGKSRLLDVWTAGAGARATVLRGRCDELGRDLPLQAVLDALGSHLRAIGPERSAAALGPEREVLAPLLGTGAPTQAFEATTGKTILFSALTSVLARLAAPRPVVLALDDVHLADASTVEWLTFVRRRSPDARVLVVVTRRPEEGAALPASSTVALAPLDLDAASEVVGAERAAELLQRSGGNPLFLVELASADDSEAMPGSIRDAVTARCERTGAAAATLRTAAIVGPGLDLDLLSSVLRAPPVEVLGHLEEGVRRRFLVEEGATFRFAHELVREALAAGAGEGRRALVHREAARVLAARPSYDPLEAAWHARLGGEIPLAAAALRRAGEIAAGRYDYAEAERYLGESIGLADDVDTRLARARIRLVGSDFDAAMDDATAALGLGGGPRALEAAAWAAYYLRDFERARRLADDGVRLAEDPDLAASCLAVAGRVRFGDGDVAGADERLVEAVRTGRGPAAVAASVFLGALRAAQGAHEDAIDLVRPGTLPGGVAGHPLVPVYALMATVQALGSTGRIADAFDAAARFVDEVERVQAWRFRPRADNFRAWLLRAVGSLGSADELNSRALETSLPGGLQESAAYALLDLVDGAFAADDPDTAAAHLERLGGIRLTEQSGRWRHRIKARLASARLALARGDHDEAIAAAVDALEDAQARRVPRFEVAARLVRAQGEAIAKEPVDVDEAVRDLGSLRRLAAPEAPWTAAALFASTGAEVFRAEADTGIAAIAARAGEHADGFLRYARRRIDAISTRRS